MNDKLKTKKVPAKAGADAGVEWEIPPGYGWVPKRANADAPAADDSKTGGGSGRAWDVPIGYFGSQFPPGELSLVAQIHFGEIKEQVEHFEDSGNVTHLWWAWRAARAFEEMPPEFMALIAPHFDRLAEMALQGKSDRRANERLIRRWVLARYYHEIRRRKQNRPGCVTSDKEARERAGKAFDKTQGTVEQWILDYEGRGQRRRKG